jgi:hypothetical protein
LAGKKAACVLIAVFCAASLYLLGHAGVASREHGTAYGIDRGMPVQLLNTSREVYLLWKDQEVKGRVVVHMGRYLHFIAVDDMGVYKGRNGFPVQTVSLLEEYEKELGDKNFLWLAMQGGMAREIYNVLSPDVLREKLRMVAGQSGVKVSEHEIETHYWGSKRTITDGIPAVEEPVLLNIDASLFSNSEPTVLLKGLKESGIRTDMLTLCLAEDNPNVTEPERERLREFYNLLKGQ